jgi:hypothetical protein
MKVDNRKIITLLFLNKFNRLAPTAMKKRHLDKMTSSLVEMLKSLITIMKRSPSLNHLL